MEAAAVRDIADASVYESMNPFLSYLFEKIILDLFSFFISKWH